MYSMLGGQGGGGIQYVGHRGAYNMLHKNISFAHESYSQRNRMS